MRNDFNGKRSTLRLTESRSLMRWVLVLLILVIGVSAVTILLKEEKHGETLLQPANTPRLAVAPIDSAVKRQKATSAATVQSPEQVAVNKPGSKAAEFDALVKSGNANDAFAAFKLLHSCSLDSSTCGDITAGQRTQAYQLLNQAVAAYVPKAAVYLVITTPDGRAPYEVYGDPAYDDWRAHARREVENAANRGDKAALSQMFSFALIENTPGKALMYFTAFADRPPVAGKDFVSSQVEILSRGLSPEQAASAIAEGHLLIKTK